MLSRSVAVELSIQLGNAVPGIVTRVVENLGEFSIVAAIKQRNKRRAIVINNTNEYALVMAALQVQAEQAGRPFMPISLRSRDRAEYVELERVG